MAKDKELADHERAHSGQPGSQVRHGTDATKVRYDRNFQPSKDGANMSPEDYKRHYDAWFPDMGKSFA